METARALAHAGAQVTLAVRDTAASRRVTGDLAGTSGRDDLAMARLDLADLTTIGALATTGATGGGRVLASPACVPCRSPSSVQITEFGGPEVLDVVDLPEPRPGDGQRLYDVSTAGVNYADTHHPVS